jgi:hypothetical protein
MSNNNLLPIESAMLSLPNVKNALSLTEVKRIQSTLSNGAKSRLAKTLELATLVSRGSEWFASQQGQSAFAQAGVTWSKEEFFLKTYGFQQSFAYKLLRASALEQEVVENFNASCDEQERAGKPSDRSLAGLLKFAKSQPTEGGGGDGEEGGEGQPSVERSQTIFTLSFKRSVLEDTAKNVSVRVDMSGEPTTTNTREEIEIAIAFLRAALDNAVQK